MPPNVDLVISFTSNSESEYANLLNSLSKAGLLAVGRRGQKQGHILIFVYCPTKTLHRLPIPISPADRIRIVHDYLSSSLYNFNSTLYDILPLHNRHFNDTWIRSWSTSPISSTQLTTIRDQFGDAIALYFSFLSSYTYALTVPATIGLLFHFFATPYNPLYSILLLLWSTAFIEYWRVKERHLADLWGSTGALNSEKPRPQYIPGFPWWKTDLRMLASLPIILLFAILLTLLLTAIFVFEAFVAHLYTGPGHKYISLAPTILFAALVPRILALYHSSALRFTAWENHFHPSSHSASLTLKIFALSALVAYLGLALSAFIYVPFGHDVMAAVQTWLFSADPQAGFWTVDTGTARQKLNPSRLYDQMFTYTVTNQVLDTLEEVALPYLLRALASLWGGSARAKAWRRARAAGMVGKKKRVVFEDELRAARGAGSAAEHEGDSEKEREEREFLGEVRSEVTLPAYELFGDYSEMVTQFGYVVLWSAIWPLAPVMALVNNVFEMRSDAFKITVHYRRPVPQRVDTIGPWLDALEFLSWLAALTNSALVYLFRPVAAGGNGGAGKRKSEVLVSALLVALAASHVYVVVRHVVRHVVRRWVGYDERERAAVRSVRDECESDESEGDEKSEGEIGFWDYDEGLDDIQKMAKDR